MKLAALKKALSTSAFLFLSALVSIVPAAPRETAHVRHVIDGDTFVLSDNQHVRLLGINAPELGKDGAPDQPLALDARTRLKNLI